MFIVDMVMGIVELITEIWFGKRYGWASSLWFMASSICLIAAALLFAAKIYIIGVIGTIASVVCFVLSCRRAGRDIRKTREAEKTDSSTRSARSE